MPVSRCTGRSPAAAATRQGSAWGTPGSAAPPPALGQQTAFFTGAFIPAQTGETFIELTYQYQLTPAVQLQPDFQYVFNPGGGLANPNLPNQQIGNEAVIGLRVNLTF